MKTLTMHQRQSFNFLKHFYFRKVLLGTIHGDYKHGWKSSLISTPVSVPASYAFTLHIGRGAGYIGGVTFFFARNSGSRNWQRRYRGQADRRAPFGFEIGWTRNGNRVPYVSH